MTLRGIDISHWQGKINWAQVAQDRNVEFVFARTTHGDANGSSTLLAVDSQLSANRSGLRHYNIRRGWYHYPGLQDATKEADYFVGHTGRADGELQFLDFEGKILNHHDPVGWALTFLNRVYQLTGNRPLIYMSLATTARFNWKPVVDANYGLNVAAWGRAADNPPKPSWWSFWAVWQTTDRAPAAGVPSAGDGDIFNGDAKQWAAYGATAGKVSPPKSVPPSKPAPKPKTYKVAHGDTLIGIADRFKFPGGYKALAKFNGIKNPNVIYVGQILKVSK